MTVECDWSQLCMRSVGILYSILWINALGDYRISRNFVDQRLADQMPCFSAILTRQKFAVPTYVRQKGRIDMNYKSKPIGDEKWESGATVDLQYLVSTNDKSWANRRRVTRGRNYHWLLWLAGSYLVPCWAFVASTYTLGGPTTPHLFWIFSG